MTRPTVADIPRRRYRRDHDGNRRLVVERDGVEGFHVAVTKSCTGCFEPGEYMGMAHYYDYDHKAGCYVGGCCHECGHTGKRRYTAWVPFFLSEEP